MKKPARRSRSTRKPIVKRLTRNTKPTTKKKVVSRKKVVAKPRRRCTTSHPCVKGITSRQFSQWLRSS